MAIGGETVVVALLADVVDVMTVVVFENIDITPIEGMLVTKAVVVKVLEVVVGVARTVFIGGGAITGTLEDELLEEDAAMELIVLVVLVVAVDGASGGAIVVLVLVVLTRAVLLTLPNTGPTVGSPCCVLVVYAAPSPLHRKATLRNSTSPKHRPSVDLPMPLLIPYGLFENRVLQPASLYMA